METRCLSSVEPENSFFDPSAGWGRAAATELRQDAAATKSVVWGQVARVDSISTTVS